MQLHQKVNGQRTNVIIEFNRVKLEVEKKFISVADKFQSLKVNNHKFKEQTDDSYDVIIQEKLKNNL